VEQSTGRCRWH